MTPTSRLIWVRMYERTGDTGLTCRRCGISQPNEMHRPHGILLSNDTVHEALCRNRLNDLNRPQLARKGRKHNSRPVLGDRVQIVVREIAPSLHQYTAIDDCSLSSNASRLLRSSRSLSGSLRRRRSRSSTPDRWGPGALRPQGLGQAAELENQIPAHPTPLTASQRQGRAGAEDGPRRGLADRRPQ